MSALENDLPEVNDDFEENIDMEMDPLSEAVSAAEKAKAKRAEAAAAKKAAAKDAKASKPRKTNRSAPKEDPDEPQQIEATKERGWYVINCYSGYERKVRKNLSQRIETMGMKELIFDIVVPTQEEIEVKDGKRVIVDRLIFPGYLLVNMILTEESWFIVRNTPGVTGFVGMGNQPIPLRPDEVNNIIKRMEADAPVVNITYKVGEKVRIVDGPFNDFRGNIAEIDVERSKVRVMVNFFGRETPVELDFLQVEKC